MTDTLTRLIGDNEPVLLAGGGASEGPLWHPEGYVTFVRHKISQLVRWDPDNGAQVIRENTGGANGATIDKQGRMVLCEGENRRVTRVEHDGTLTTIAHSFQGKRFNKPNDIVTRSDGSLYFTDPQAMTPKDKREFGFAGVFRITPDGDVELATDGCESPNGLAFSPDESVLYVAITRLDEHCLDEVKRGEVCPHQKIRAFDVAPDGSLSNNRVFADMTAPAPGKPDGMKVDSEGRVYCTGGGGGIWVFDPDGTRLAVIDMPEESRNLAFGGPDLSTLYVAAGDSLYSLETNVRGLPAA